MLRKGQVECALIAPGGTCKWCQAPLPSITLRGINECHVCLSQEESDPRRKVEPRGTSGALLLTSVMPQEDFDELTQAVEDLAAALEHARVLPARMTAAVARLRKALEDVP